MDERHGNQGRSGICAGERKFHDWSILYATTVRVPNVVSVGSVGEGVELSDALALVSIISPFPYTRPAAVLHSEAERRRERLVRASS